MLSIFTDGKYVFNHRRFARAERIMGFFVLFALLLLEGFSCAPTQKIINEETRAQWLPYLEAGKTTKEHVLLRLGVPSATFENERILTYRMMLNQKEGLVVIWRELDVKQPWLSQWVKANYSLVLIFDDQQILKLHSLLRVR